MTHTRRSQTRPQHAVTSTLAPLAGQATTSSSSSSPRPIAKNSRTPSGSPPLTMSISPLDVNHHQHQLNGQNARNSPVNVSHHPASSSHTMSTWPSEIAPSNGHTATEGDPNGQDDTRQTKIPRLHPPAPPISAASTTSRTFPQMDTNQARSHALPSNPYMYSSSPPQIPSQPSPPPLTLKSFDVIGTLGTGTFGRVLLVKLRDPLPNTSVASHHSNYFALKVLEKARVVKMKQVEHVKSEKDILAAVRHPFAVNLHATFQDSNCVYLLMEFARGGEIFSYLRKAGKFPVDVTRFYIATLVLLLDHLHSRDIIYRDLKPENLLLDAQGYTKLTDFGFAKRIPKGRTFTLCGTPEFLAPEIIRGRGHGKAADWWALGILTYEMLCGHPPFWSSDEEAASSGGPFATYEKILRGDLAFPKHVDVLSRDFIRSLLNQDLSKRLGNLSGGARDVKRHLFFHNVDWNLLLARNIRPPIIPPPIVSSSGGSDPMKNFARYSDPDPATMPGLFGTSDPLMTHTNMTPEQAAAHEAYQAIFDGF